ncbi:MAG: hypothetical protein CMJ18_10105 [Phycisphaeraceae bacterium]|nr:hypothetical protein [Phycisphaeraceae bacterium]
MLESSTVATLSRFCAVPPSSSVNRLSLRSVRDEKSAATPFTVIEPPRNDVSWLVSIGPRTSRSTFSRLVRAPIRMRPPSLVDSREVTCGLASVKLATAEMSTSPPAPVALMRAGPLIPVADPRSTRPPFSASISRSALPSPGSRLPVTAITFRRSSTLPEPLARRKWSTELPPPCA